MAEVCEVTGADVTALAAALSYDDRIGGRFLKPGLGFGVPPLRGVRVAAWGAAFKPNSDDIRDAPALDVADALQRAGAHVTVHDPVAMDNARRSYPHLRYAESALDAASQADVVVLLTEWTQFRQVDPEALGRVVRQRHIVDGRHALDPQACRAAGWTYRALGRR